MLQSDVAEDFVIATGKHFSVPPLRGSAGPARHENKWRGKGVDEIGVEYVTGRTLSPSGSLYFRPTEVETLLGRFSKAASNSAAAEVASPTWLRKWLLST